MTRREQYSLTFYKVKDPKSNMSYPICQREEVGPESVLQFIGNLSAKNVQFIIREIDKAQNGLDYDEYPSSDSYEDIDLHLISPNVIIDEILTIPMTNFKELLNEWKLFVES